MTDYFALLDEPRRPWLEPEALKQKFFALSASAHPDKVPAAGAAERSDAAKSFAELNAAYQCLTGPKSRLRHLLELELGAKPKDIEQIPGALADLFAEVAATCRSADGFLAEKSRVTSPLLQVHWFERGQEWVDNLNRWQQKLNGLHGRLLEELKALDERWVGTDGKPRPEVLAEAERLYRLFGYFNRWSGQIQERVVRLAV
jgi:curved DNA-binding protein CbpA